MRLATVAAMLLVLTACGGHREPSAESVARAWSAALDRNDNEAAALLFADRATIVQGASEQLATHADAVRWNADLPCGGRITSIEKQAKDQVLVVFALQHRPRHQCDAATGTPAAAIFKVEHGKIVLWHQTDAPASAEI